MKSESMQTTAVGVIGTGGSLVIAQYNEIIGAIGVTLTAAYMAFKCYDWITAKILANRQKKNHKKT